MITNQDLVIEYLAKWLGDYAKSAGKNVLVVGFGGTQADALLLHICSKATEQYGKLTTHAISFPYNNVNIKAIYNGNLTYSIEYDYPPNIPEHYFLQCHQIAEAKAGIIVGAVDRTTGLYYRSYGKRAGGSADIFPLFDLNYSEIIEITSALWPNINNWTKENININDLEFANEAEDL